MGRGAFTIGSIAGIRIALHPSWLIIFFLITLSFALGDVSGRPSGFPSTVNWIVGAGVSILFFASVLAHELSHALLARRFGMEVRDITLFVFGGAATLEGDAKRPRDEAIIAAAGPITSVLVGAGFWLLAVALNDQRFSDLAATLGFANVTLGLFNLIPGYPMDGGRILRAILWRLRGDQYAATRSAAMVGRGFGYLLVAGGALLAFQSREPFQGIWIALIGWFIASAADASSAQASVQRTLQGVSVRDVMEEGPPSVSPNETVAELVNDRLMRGEGRSFLVRHDDGGLAGIVTLSDVQRLARDHWPGARVTDVMTRYNELATVKPDDSLESAMELLQQREVNQLPVVDEDGRGVVGVLTRAGILRFVDTRMKLGV